jgi:hypothetical protein
VDFDQTPVRYLNLKLAVKRLDRRLTDIFCASFAADMTLPDRLKLMLSYEPFGDRDFCRDELAVCYADVGELIALDLAKITAELAREAGSAVVAVAGGGRSRQVGGGASGADRGALARANQPPLAAAMATLEALRSRAAHVMSVCVAALPAKIYGNAQFGALQLQHLALCSTIEAAEAALRAQWLTAAANIPVGALLNSALLTMEGSPHVQPRGSGGSTSPDDGSSDEPHRGSGVGSIRLQTPAATGHHSHHLSLHPNADDGLVAEQLPAITVNFDPALAQLFREARYMLHLGVPVAPELALIVAKEGAALSCVKTTLEAIVKVYEKLRSADDVSPCFDDCTLHFGVRC